MHRFIKSPVINDQQYLTCCKLFEFLTTFRHLFYYNNNTTDVVTLFLELIRTHFFLQI